MARDPYREPGRALGIPRTPPRPLLRRTALVVVFVVTLFAAHLAFLAGAPLKPCALVVFFVAAGVAALLPPEEAP